LNNIQYTYLDWYPVKHCPSIIVCVEGCGVANAIPPLLSQDVADPYPDLRRFLDAIYEKANLPVPVFNQRDLVTRCINAFVAQGMRDEQSVVNMCEYINSDDLALKEAKVPILLIGMIYQAILDFRKKAPSQVCRIVRSFFNIFVCMA
jgi:hypothetical protein